MDVYVLIENGRVLGAGAELTDAQAIADRRGDRWAEWDEETEGAWRRSRPRPNGGLFRDWQQIVRVPLAGYVGDWPTLKPIDETGPALLRDVPALTTQARIAQAWDGSTDPIADMRAVSGPNMSAYVERIIQMVSEAQASIWAAFGEMPPDKVRVGTGAAWDYMQRAIDSVPMVDSAPDSVSINAVMGIPIVRDPNIPPDQIRIGSWVYTIGTAAGPIAEGTMVAINKQTLYESMRPRNPFPPSKDALRYRGFTTPPV